MKVTLNSSKIEDIRKAVISSIEHFEALYGPIDEVDYSPGLTDVYIGEIR